MFLSAPKLAGPVKHLVPDPDTVILTSDRSLKWPVLLSLAAVSLLVGGIWLPFLLMYFPVYGLPALIAALYFAFLRANVVLSRRNSTLELRPRPSPSSLWQKTVRLDFSQIREFLVESEFDLGGGDVKPFVWHLTAITVDGKHHRLTWHFARQPVILAGEEASRITGKPLRVENDPYKSTTWEKWGYNFLR
jgi:hypothetical protein